MGGAFITEPTAGAMGVATGGAAAWSVLVSLSKQAVRPSASAALVKESKARFMVRFLGEGRGVWAACGSKPA